MLRSLTGIGAIDLGYRAACGLGDDRIPELQRARRQHACFLPVLPADGDAREVGAQPGDLDPGAPGGIRALETFHHVLVGLDRVLSLRGLEGAVRLSLARIGLGCVVGLGGSSATAWREDGQDGTQQSSLRDVTFRTHV